MTKIFGQRLTKRPLLLALVLIVSAIAFLAYLCKRPATSVTACVKTPSLLFQLGDSRSRLSGLFTPSCVDLTLLTDTEGTEEDAPGTSKKAKFNGGKRFMDAVVTGMDVSDGVRAALDVAGGALQIKLEPADSNDAIDSLDFQAPVRADVNNQCTATEHLAHFTVRPSRRRYLAFAMRFHERPRPEPDIPLKPGGLVSFENGPERMFLQDAVLNVNHTPVSNVKSLALSRLDEGVMRMSLHFDDQAIKKPRGDLTADHLVVDVRARTNQVSMSNVPGGQLRNVAPSHLETFGSAVEEHLASLATVLSIATGLVGLFQKLRRKRRSSAKSSLTETQEAATR